jgi:hypothetical protein
MYIEVEFSALHVSTLPLRWTQTCHLIYHGLNDFVDIPKFISSLISDMNFT